jgi:hypothetical protein
MIEKKSILKTSPASTRNDSLFKVATNTVHFIVPNNLKNKQYIFFIEMLHEVNCMLSMKNIVFCSH